MAKTILMILTLAAFASGAEFEVNDRFSVDGSSLLRGTLTVSGGRVDVQSGVFTAYSLTVGTSAAYNLVVATSGYVGIGAGNPVQKLDVDGGIKIGNVTDCTANKGGTIRWTNGHISVCNGSEWRQLDNQPPPYVESVSPVSGPVATATPISITGTGFASGATVRIGTVAATVVNVVSDTSITSNTGIDASGGIKNVVVTNPDGFYGILTNAFTYGLFATGGTVTTVNVGGTNYRVHTFADAGTFTFNCTGFGNVEVLVVAGGGGGGKESNANNYGGGGGGAGGLVYNSGYYATGSITVTVGHGGAGATSEGRGTNGENSVFGSITASGGGGGGGSLNQAGAAGGSGGGGVYQGGAGGAASPTGQGNAGGAANTTNGCAAGGGGAGAAGQSVTSLYGGGGTDVNAGNGGAGLAYSISGSPVTYAGGGGGGGYVGTAGAGVSGGGNGGLGNTPGTNASANTGSGGGGGGGNPSGPVSSGGNGGSGIVIVRYPLP